jgi:hypothetical protein
MKYVGGKVTFIGKERYKGNYLGLTFKDILVKQSTINLFCLESTLFNVLLGFATEGTAPNSMESTA